MCRHEHARYTSDEIVAERSQLTSSKIENTAKYDDFVADGMKLMIHPIPGSRIPHSSATIACQQCPVVQTW